MKKIEIIKKSEKRGIRGKKNTLIISKKLMEERKFIGMKNFSKAPKERKNS
jgi:hypothetical protein